MKLKENYSVQFTHTHNFCNLEKISNKFKLSLNFISLFIVEFS